MKKLVLICLALAGVGVAKDVFRGLGRDIANPPQTRVLFSDGRRLYLGDYRLLGNSEAAPVRFERDHYRDLSWETFPDPTNDTKPTWSRLQPAVPVNTTEGYDALLMDPSSDFSRYWTRFIFQKKKFIKIHTHNPPISEDWFAKKTKIKGVWIVQWQPSEESVIPIHLEIVDLQNLEPL